MSKYNRMVIKKGCIVLYCPNCGNDTGDSKFCQKCGTEVAENKSLSESQNSNGKTKVKRNKAIGCGIIVAIIAVIIGIIVIAPKIFETRENESREKSVSYIELSDTELGLKGVHVGLVSSESIDVLSFHYVVTNVSDKNIESLKFYFSIYNDEGVEKSSASYSKDILLKSGESSSPDEFDYWKFYASKYYAGYGMEFEDSIINGEYIVDYKSVKLTKVDINFSDETSATQIMDYPIDKIYLKGNSNDIYYYFTRDDNNRISEQCSTVIDPENGVWDIPQEVRDDEPYYLPVS